MIRLRNTLLNAYRKGPLHEDPALDRRARGPHAPALAAGPYMAPDGSWHGSPPQMAPNGQWVGGQPQMAPNGAYVDGQPKMAPGGGYVGGQPRLAPNGRWVGENGLDCAAKEP